MKLRKLTNILFVVDPTLITTDQSQLITRFLEEEKIKFSVSSAELADVTPTLFFIEKKNLKKISHFKNKFIVLPTIVSEDLSGFPTINFNSYEDISRFVHKFFAVFRS